MGLGENVYYPHNALLPGNWEMDSGDWDSALQLSAP
jgi:hypothetical protein